MFHQKGVAVIEMALTLGFLLLLTVGITEFGRALWYYSAIQKVTRDGSRCLSYTKWENTSVAKSAAGNCLSTVTTDAGSAGVLVTPSTVEMMLDGSTATTSSWGVGNAPRYVGIHVQHDMTWLWSVGGGLPAPGDSVRSQIYATMPLMN